MQRYAHKHDASVSLFPFDPCLPFLAHLSQPLPIAQAPKEWFLANLLTRPEFQFMACTVTSPVQTCCKGPWDSSYLEAQNVHNMSQPQIPFSHLVQKAFKRLWILCSYILHMHNIRKKFRSQTSDLWADAATVVRAAREEKSQKRKRQKRKSQWRENQGARKGRKVAKLLKRRVRSH